MGCQVEMKNERYVTKPSWVPCQSLPTLCDTVDCSPQAPLSMGFSRQEYWSRLPFPPPGDLPDPGIKPASLVSPALAGRFFTTEPPGNPLGPSESESESRSVMSDSLQLHELYSPWTSPSQNTGVGSLSLLQWIIPTQGSNPGLPHCRWILYH